ncbi:MAG: hypothetical protein IPM49_16835 [Flavobacteriales bacterium]|nr:hypothetical protein [Flavobacteriales bacterium]
METSTDHTRMTLEELQRAEKRTRNEQITVAVLIGFLIGVIIYGVATKGFGLLHTLLPGGLILLLVRSSANINQRLAGIRAEKERRRTG